MREKENHNSSTFPMAAGIFLGLGMGGFFDGILLHQVLQWHHMVSQPYLPNTLANLELNTLWDGQLETAAAAPPYVQ